jgi:hypothetical protein
VLGTRIKEKKIDKERKKREIIVEEKDRDRVVLRRKKLFMVKQILNTI